ncbi:DUF2867 domain-containing protein [Neotabrizicola sp. VNH66]|uniref:DUF2867 domain-containing protein n=1 Tax=Neotabrizicola sp. VNH66 TaxID=3400918 RepID=UPI003C04C51F
MPRIRTDRLPATSSLWSLCRPGDFLDCTSVESPLSPRAAALRALALPGWARALLGLRNALVRPFGLRTGPEAGQEAIGMFPVQKDGPDECVLGFDDRHLNFRIAVLRDGERLFLSTWVHPHNPAGRAYLAAVMPFHILITRSAARRMAPGR